MEFSGEYLTILYHWFMSFITLLPYLGRAGEIELWNDIRVWNYEEFKNIYIPNAEKRAQSDRIVNMYENPQWVNAISKGSNGLCSFDAKTIRHVQLLLFITTLAKGNTLASAIGNDSTSSSSENFTYSSYSIDPRATSIKHKMDPIFKNSYWTLPIRNGVIPKPFFMKERTPENTKIDMQLLNALLKLRKGKNRLLEKIYDSAEMMVVPLMNNNIISSTAVYILIVCAFENLLGEKRHTVKNAIDRYFQGAALHPSFIMNNGKIKPETDANGKQIKRTRYALWYEQLVRFRNKVAHGGGMPEISNQNYHGQSHRYIAVLMYIACLKGIIEENTGVVLPGTVIRKKQGGDMWFVYKE